MLKILVVDDEGAIRETLKDLFEDEGYAVDLARDGVEAVEALRERGPVALVFSDLVMPRMSGAELYRTMKADAELAKIPFLMSTGHPTEAPTGVLLIRKPVDVNVLVDTVRGLLVASGQLAASS